MEENEPVPTTPGTGTAGLVLQLATTLGAGMAIGLAVFRQLEPGQAMAAAILIMLAVWIASDGLRHLVGQSRSKPPLALSFRRIVTKLAGLVALTGILVLATAVFPYFRALDAVTWLRGSGLLSPVPIIVILAAAAIYIALADRLCEDPDDYLHQVGRAVLMQDFRMDDTLFALRVTIIKGFFLLLMFSAGMAGFTQLAENPFWNEPILSARWFGQVVNLVYLVDLVLAASGYVAALKLFGWHIRATETSVLGWVVCLACYEPFYGSLSTAFVPYGQGPGWDALIREGSGVFVVWSLAVLLCHVVYVWATIAIGPRFSNLTHRGIVTTGPYRFTRHPAYLAKNLAWWLFALPGFVASDLQDGLSRAAMLAIISLIYVLRARAEESMLGRDPAYRAYSARIDGQGLFSRLFASSSALRN